MDHPYPNSVHLIVASVKKSMKFYTEKLGFTVKTTFPDDKKPVFASLLLDRQSIMLGASLSVEEAKKFDMSKEELLMVKNDARAFAKSAHGVGVSLYVCVADVDAHYKAAKKKRVEILAQPKTQFYGLREYFAVDPDGYRLVFYTPVPQEKPIADGGRKPADVPAEQDEEAVADA
jgi:uncharacterized glyoxalase superfamily protein PhnB